MPTERTYELTSKSEVATPARKLMNLGGMLRHSAQRLPQKPAIICGGQVVSYQALDRSTDVLARACKVVGWSR